MLTGYWGVELHGPRRRRRRLRLTSYLPTEYVVHTLVSAAPYSVRKPCIGAGQHPIYCTRYMLTSSSQQNRKTTKNPCTDTQYGYLSHCSEPRIPVHALLRTEYSVRDYGPYHTLHHMEPPDDAFQILRSSSIVRCRNRLVCLCPVCSTKPYSTYLSYISLFDAVRLRLHTLLEEYMHVKRVVHGVVHGVVLPLMARPIKDRCSYPKQATRPHRAPY